MYFNQIYYNLTCQKCGANRDNGNTTILTKKETTKLLKEDLILEMKSFSEINCDSCDSLGDWTLVSIDLKRKNKALKKFELELTKTDNKVEGEPKTNDFSEEQLNEIYINIRGRVEELKGQYLPSDSNGTASFLVETFDEKPYLVVSNYHVDGISIEEIITQLDVLTGDITHKGISGKLNKKLELAFEDLKLNQTNPLVITQLQSKDKLTNFYIIAKLPDSDLYYGILENEFTQQKIIEGVPLVNFEPLDLREVEMTPFRTQEYIINGVKKGD